MKKRKINKKGISPLIATVLLIGFVIAVILLIVLWGKNYIEELAEKRGALAEKQQECLQVELDVLKACWAGTEADIVVRNKADVPIHKFVFRAIGKTGEPVEVREPLGGLETKSYNFQFSTDVGVVNNIEIIPHLKVALGHYVPCSKQSVTVRIYDCG